MKENSVPIYWGNKEIGKEFNSKSFVNVHDFGSLKEAALLIEFLDNDISAYSAMLNEPWLKDNRLNEYFDDERLFFFGKIPL